MSKKLKNADAQAIQRLDEAVLNLRQQREAHVQAIRDIDQAMRLLRRPGPVRVAQLDGLPPLANPPCRDPADWVHEVGFSVRTGNTVHEVGFSVRTGNTVNAALGLLRPGLTIVSARLGDVARLKASTLRALTVARTRVVREVRSVLAEAGLRLADDVPTGSGEG